MKIQAKLFIILMLFLGFMVVSKLESYADSSSNIPYVDIVKAEVERRLPEEYDSYCFVNQYNSTNDYNYYSIVYYNSDSSIVSTSDGYYVFSANLLSDVKSCQFWSCCYSRSDRDFSYFKLSMTDNFLSPTNGNYYVRDLNRYFSRYVECVSNRVIYSSNATQESLIGKFYDDLSFIDGGVGADKINLYELNLTDLDYNDQVHKFNLATYTNSVSYDEIMEYYNKDYPYAIFVTDYTRILTYDNEQSMNFQQGAYLLSGYIDFLVNEKAFFYYSNYHNRIMSRSGTFIDQSPSRYRVRFSFKAVYSEDTSDPMYIDWTVSNGDLLYTTLLDDFDYIYFVGSNYTIYYAEEKRGGKFKDLTNDIRKLGYLNHKEHGKVLDSSLMDERFYFVHDFNFTGGVTHHQYLSNPSYEDDRFNLIGQIYNDYGISDVKKDGSNGNSDVNSNNIRDSQFKQGDVTDTTTNEQDENATGNFFGPMNNKDLDDSNWGILDYLSYFFHQLLGINNNSNQSSKDISNSINTISDKFSFSNNIINNANEIKDYIINTQETHKYYLNINHKYLSGNVCIIDLSWYEPYKPTVDAFICAFAYLAFTWHIFCKIPELIRGASATSYVSDIQAYSQTGFGRSSSIHKGGF